MTYTLDQLNRASAGEAMEMLDGLYEHTPWVAREAIKQRPFADADALQAALVAALDAGKMEQKLELIRVHPELAGKAMEDNTLTAESTSEQKQAGLTNCSPEELARIRQMNKDYNVKFGFPFVLCVRGPSGDGLTRHQIMDIFARRLDNDPAIELNEALHQINLIATLRLRDRFAG